MQIWPQFSWLKALRMTIVSQFPSSRQVSSVILVWRCAQPFTLNWICFYLDVFWAWFFGRQLSIFDLGLKKKMTHALTLAILVAVTRNWQGATSWRKNSFWLAFPEAIQSTLAEKEWQQECETLMALHLQPGNKTEVRK